MIVGRTNLIPADREYRDWLNDAGFAVTAVDDGAAGTTNLDGFDVVVVSASVDARAIGTWIADVEAPILSNEPYIARRLGFGSGGTNLRRQRTIRIVDPGSPLADGNSGTVTITSAPADVVGVRGVDRNVDVVATAAASASVATVVSVEAGTLLRTGAAPARRVGFFLGTTTPLSTNAAGCGDVRRVARLAHRRAGAADHLVVEQLVGLPRARWWHRASGSCSRPRSSTRRSTSRRRCRALARRSTPTRCGSSR